MEEERVRSLYDRGTEYEWQRHDHHRMEFALSMRILDAHLPKSGRILDCGGGPGRYALWLAGKGYDVTLFSCAEHLLALAGRPKR